jgi:peptide/nickel transport system permease protein
MRWVKIIERILATIPVMLGVAIMVFAFMRLTPGDPVDLMMGEAGVVSKEEIRAIREQFKLDQPLPKQLLFYLSGLTRGDLGTSFKKKEPVWNLIRDRFPATVELALWSLLFGLAIGIPIGIWSAVKQASALDRISMFGAFFGISMPPFWLGLILIIFFSAYLGWLPVSGRIVYGFEPKFITGMYVVDSLLTGRVDSFVSSLEHLLLPSFTLGLALASIVARVMRSSMLEVMRQDYVTLARAKGNREFRVISKHALRNALIPTVTVVGIQIGVLLGGNMIVETVFGWPGIGRLAVDAIFARDYPLVQGVVIIYSLTYVMANLMVDILYTFINPKMTL